MEQVGCFHTHIATHVPQIRIIYKEIDGSYQQGFITIGHWLPCIPLKSILVMYNKKYENF